MKNTVTSLEANKQIKQIWFQIKKKCSLCFCQKPNKKNLSCLCLIPDLHFKIYLFIYLSLFLDVYSYWSLQEEKTKQLPCKVSKSFFASKSLPFAEKVASISAMFVLDWTWFKRSWNVSRGLHWTVSLPWGRPATNTLMKTTLTSNLTREPEQIPRLVSVPVSCTGESSFPSTRNMASWLSSMFLHDGISCTKSLKCFSLSIFNVIDFPHDKSSIVISM